MMEAGQRTPPYRLQNYPRFMLTKVGSSLKWEHQHKVSRYYQQSKLRMYGFQLPMSASDCKVPQLPVAALAERLLSNNVIVLGFRRTCRQPGKLSAFMNSA